MSIKNLHLAVSGQGPALVLVHGWGLNSLVWQPIQAELEQHFEVHLIDLAGFGLSRDVPVADELDGWAKMAVEAVDKPAIWLGWSLGGLIATQVALHYPDQVEQLVTVASSPKFSTSKDWQGIKPQVLSLFQQQLQQDFSKTLERFLAIQAMGSDSARQDILALKNILSARPLPNPQALEIGLELLDKVDLRKHLSKVDVPFFRIYGRLDSLVSQKLIAEIDALAPQSQCVILPKASHAPFISHKVEFLEALLGFLLQK